MSNELRCYQCGKILLKAEIDNYIQKEVIPELKFREPDINKSKLQDLINLAKEDMRKGIKDIYCMKCQHINTEDMGNTFER